MSCASFDSRTRSLVGREPLNAVMNTGGQRAGDHREDHDAHEQLHECQSRIRTARPVHPFTLHDCTHVRLTITSELEEVAWKLTWARTIIGGPLPPQVTLMDPTHAVKMTLSCRKPVKVRVGTGVQST